MDAEARAPLCSYPGCSEPGNVRLNWERTDWPSSWWCAEHARQRVQALVAELKRQMGELGASGGR